MAEYLGKKRLTAARVRKTKIVMNIGAGLKPVDQITDRAKRYRANRPVSRPSPPKRCNYCGSGRNVVVDHVNGDESDGSRRNLKWACKRCNTAKGLLFKRLGVGVRTRQYNPAKRRGKSKISDAQLGWAFTTLRDENADPAEQVGAMELVMSMSRAERSRYNREYVWPIRKQRYGPSGRKDGGAVPF